jgi:hypothetical protein
MLISQFLKFLKLEDLDLGDRFDGGTKLVFGGGEGVNFSG